MGIDQPTIRMRRVRPDAVLPKYQTDGASGMDLHAVAAAVVPPEGGRALVPTGLAFAIPSGFEGQVRPRSGLAAKHGVTVLNAPGTIDADFRGEVGVVLVNHHHEPFYVAKGDRIAQIVFARVARAELVEVESLDETVRGDGGYGSTGR